MVASHDFITTVLKKMLQVSYFRNCGPIFASETQSRFSVKLRNLNTPTLSLSTALIFHFRHENPKRSTTLNLMDSDEAARAVESSAEGESVTCAEGESVACEGDVILEPYEGMEFESEDAAKIFYDEYARRIGFVMRVMSCRRSERDGRILARRLGCNKEGHCVSIRGKFGPVRKPRPSTREGCKAMIHVKSEKSGKWVITKFVKDHNHPLVVSPREARQTMDEKDKKIQELTTELRNKKRLCAAYQEQLTAFMKVVEDHSDRLSKKVHNVVSNLKEFEAIDQELLHRR